MPYEHEAGSFTLFKNTRKEEGSKQPDYRGEGRGLNGEYLEFAGWIRKSDKGSFLSCTLQAPRPKTQQPKRTTAPSDGGMDIDNDLPF